MLKLILVPTDMSAFAEQALPTALMIAKREHADLEIVHVYEHILPELTQNAPPLDPTLDLELHRRARERLEKLAERLHKETHVSVRATLLEGAVEEELASYIEKRHADLVVMATHGKGGLSVMWLGDVTEDLVRRSFAPVLLVKPNEKAPATTPARSFGRVLIPLDGSRLAEEAIDHAVVVAGVRDVEYLLLHVLPPFNDDEPIAINPVDDLRYQEAKDYLEGIAKNFRALGVNMNYRTFRHESAARAILETADNIAADLIAMETHGRGGLTRLIMGGVADKVLRGSKVPMLMHRPHAQEKSHAGEESAASTASGSGRSK
jgi:nucleotide-binding universal stress UspA family protein